MSLFGWKQCSSGNGLRGWDTYNCQHGFPVLRSRIAMPMNHFSSIGLRTRTKLWDDERDPASWYMFWLVLIISGAVILLGFLQAIFQIKQT